MGGYKAHGRVRASKRSRHLKSEGIHSLALEDNLTSSIALSSPSTIHLSPSQTHLKMYSPRAILPALVLTAISATVATADAPGPLYQIPGQVSSEGGGGDSKQCEASTSAVIGGGEMLVSDCEAILDDLEAGESFILALTWWRDSTALEDHFWVYVTSGSCQLALKRVDGLNDTV